MAPVLSLDDATVILQDKKMHRRVKESRSHCCWLEELDKTVLRMDRSILWNLYPYL